MKQLEIEIADYKLELESAIDINKTLEASIQKLSLIKNQEIQILNNEIMNLENIIIPNLNTEIRQLELALENADRDRINK